MIESLYEKFKQSAGVSTDTRKIKQGSIFFALTGPKFNANEFAEEAIEKGAKYAVIDDASYKKDERYLVVEDALKALQELANYHRRKLNIPFLAITGSNGKTTTKELVNAVLNQKYKTYATVGNLNNHIGVPLTILAMDDTIELAIVEMGANKIGDIRELCSIAEPTHGFITNIGKAHIEGFGGYEGVLRGKTELYDFLLKNNGKVFINSQDSVLQNMGKRFKKPVYFPSKGDFFHCDLIDAEPFVKYTTEEGNEVLTNLIGKYNFHNIAAALCVGKFFDVPSDKANEAVKNYIPSNNRSQIVKKGTNTIILDAYNANPSSMQAAIENLEAMSANHKMAILGDMFELGTESLNEHKRIAYLIADYSFDQVVFCGSYFEDAAPLVKGAKHFKYKDQLVEWLKTNNFRDSLILIKASRGMELEPIVEYL